MIIPSLLVKRQPAATSDLYGQPQLGAVTWEKVVPIKLKFTAQHTTVRTDSSASHGHAYETTSDVVILAMPRSKINIDDILTIGEYRVVVITKHPRYRVNGRLDHLEIHCAVWK
jgi:plasmid replication initiation protein